MIYRNVCTCNYHTFESAWEIFSFSRILGLPCFPGRDMTVLRNHFAWIHRYHELLGEIVHLATPFPWSSRLLLPCFWKHRITSETFTSFQIILQRFRMCWLISAFSHIFSTPRWDGKFIRLFTGASGSQKGIHLTTKDPKATVSSCVATCCNVSSKVAKTDEYVFRTRSCDKLLSKLWWCVSPLTGCFIGFPTPGKWSSNPPHVSRAFKGSTTAQNHQPNAMSQYVEKLHWEILNYVDRCA